MSVKLRIALVGGVQIWTANGLTTPPINRYLAARSPMLTGEIVGKA